MNECLKRKLDVQVNFAEDQEEDYKENFVIEDEEKQPGKAQFGLFLHYFQFQALLLETLILQKSTSNPCLPNLFWATMNIF